ncbi:MAG: hypothetical protein QGF21_02050 [Vicinamibacterales bacterium]|jgi:hypothetical protein|nr:hypothetical protein [Acidobacteriota bacterium]MDP7471092.1 hypothetical protein [Vicinamibacterales bacterium]MDP7670706.1 hypothetical protein [Vicinamibacterales bacterium]HJO39011.1 hypothetical protein [Vicinamibacterales bacterium]|tara:strand:- start:1634 stop:2059 length:426 start_codon:yes stop_codon:yes gene_type:complete
MNVSEVRQKVQRTIAEAKRRSSEQRAAREVAQRDYDQFLEGVAIPVCRMILTALKAEGHPFALATPPGVVRLESTHAPGSFVELVLDESGDTPAVLVRSNVRLGRRTAGTERPLARGRALPSLTREDVLDAVLAEIEPLVG